MIKEREQTQFSPSTIGNRNVYASWTQDKYCRLLYFALNCIYGIKHFNFILETILYMSRAQNKFKWNCYLSIYNSLKILYIDFPTNTCFFNIPHVVEE